MCQWFIADLSSHNSMGPSFNQGYFSIHGVSSGSLLTLALTFKAKD